MLTSILLCEPVRGGPVRLRHVASPTLPPLVWLENLTSPALIDDTIKVKEWGLAHAGTVDAALSQRDTLDLIKQAVPPSLAAQVEEVMNSATSKLGGKPVPGPVMESTQFGGTGQGAPGRGARSTF